MRVGIVSMYETVDETGELVRAVSSMGVTPYVIQGQRKAKVLHAVHTEKDIRHWIFSGGETAVTDEGGPQVPLELLTRKDKTFLLICYSMESVLVQLGFAIDRRAANKKELVRLSLPLSINLRPSLREGA